MNSNNLSSPAYTVSVPLGDAAYDIYIGSGLSGLIQAGLRRVSKFVIITDANVASAQAEWMNTVFPGAPVFVLPAGEQTKSITHLAEIYNFLANEQMDRRSAIVALGGGVVGDIAGLAAGTFNRGIDCYQIPTTLLAMVDSSVGGKTGINLPQGKNLVGVFHQPKAVFIDVDFLKTLPEREFRAGMGEVVKYGLLGDVDFYNDLKVNPISKETSMERLAEVIQHCCQMKSRIVVGDEREESAGPIGRALLNLGHTFGHAIETVTNYKTYLHGEAVSIGLVMAARLSEALGFLETSDVVDIEQTLFVNGLPVALKEPLAVEAVMAAMLLDKKVKNGKLHFIILHRIGDAVKHAGIEIDLVQQVLETSGCTQ